MRISIINFAVADGSVNLFILVIIAAAAPPCGVQFLIVTMAVVTSASTEATEWRLSVEKLVPTECAPPAE